MTTGAFKSIGKKAEMVQLIISLRNNKTDNDLDASNDGLWWC